MGGQAASNEHSKVVNGHIPEPEPCESIERDTIFKVPKNPNYVTQISHAESLKGLFPANNCRYDSSLGKFLINGSVSSLPLYKHDITCFIRHSFSICF